MKKLDTINIGQSPNDHSGDAHRTAFDRINQNFQAIGPAIGLLESQAIARPLDEPGTDLNALADTGVYYQNADERAASGKNYPLPRAGLLRVWNTGALRYQVYISDGAGTAVASHIYWRVWHAGAWTAWSRAAEQSDLQAVQALAAAAIPAAQKGAALGVATLDGQGLIPQVQVPPLRAASLPQAAHDLDGIVAPGAYRQETDAGAAAGAHYPAPRAGFLEVQATGGTVLQAYTADAGAGQAPQRYWRVRGEGLSWSAWAEAVAQDWIRTHRGAPQGIAALDGDGAVPAAQLLKPLRAHALPYMGPLPAEADLDNYALRGLYSVASISTASAGKHFPVAQAGHLEVLSAAGQGGQPVSGAVQVYRALNSNSAYTRSLVGESWTPWKKIATTEDINEASGSYMTHVRLAGAGVDLNRCYLGESYYTWDAGETMTAGLNFPPAAPAAGVLYTAVASTGRVLQTVLLDAGPAAKPGMYTRSGDGAAGAWGAWRISGGLSGIAQLPKADAGEVYVDGVGWMAWDAAAPAGYYLKPGQRNTRLEITASGSVPVPAYVRRVYVRAIGGGGGGAYSHQGATENTANYGTVYIGSGGGGGGGAGEYYEGELAIAPGIPLAITIGAGGGPGSSTTDGTAGGQTLIQQGASVLKSLSGGGGGGRASYTFGGVSGAGGGQPGGTGTAWFAGLSGYASPPGNGGGGGFSPFGAGGPGGHRSGSLNYAGGAGYPPHSRAWGAGGGGGGGSLGAANGYYATGAVGRSGVVILEY